MSAGWTVIAALAVCSFLVRAAGPLLLGERPLPPRLAGVVDLLAPALLSALIVTETMGGEQGVEVGESLAGVAAAGLLLLRRPQALLSAIFAAAAVTALLRAL
jgi:branched-subunit amino acid transport protein